MVKRAQNAQIVQVMRPVLAHRDDVVDLAPIAAAAPLAVVQVLTSASSTTPCNGPIAFVLRPVVLRVLTAFLWVVLPRHGSAVLPLS